MKRGLLWAGILLFLVVPRLVFLGADAYPDLCWGSGIWSDEGFYTYNARNATLFGREVLDDFNNRTIAPLLDLIQGAVFRAAGVGLVSARAISVVFGLLSLLLFYDALRRVFGRRVGLTGLLLLGGEYSYLFYNRLALMESPAVCVSCLALWFWAVGGVGGLVGCGAVAMSLIAWKNNFLILLPVPFLVLLWRRASWKLLGAYTAGVVLAFALYLLLWGIPHRAEIVHMNDFYRREQLQPKNATQALWMVRRGWFAYKIGMMQRLETRTPVLITLALAGLVAFPRRSSAVPTARGQRRQDTIRLLWLWFAFGLALLSVLRYTPTRYYLIFYVPMAALAAVTLWRLPLLWRKLRTTRLGALGAFALLLGLFYHAGMPLYWVSPLKDFVIQAALVVGTLLSIGALACLRRARVPRARPLATLVLAAFCLISYSQTLWYFTHLRYETAGIAAQLATLTEPGSVILGDWAPNVCLNGDRRAIPVLKGLANDRKPVQRFNADYILVGDMRFQQRYWQSNAPEVYQYSHWVKTFTLYDYKMSLYRVPKGGHP